MQFQISPAPQLAPSSLGGGVCPSPPSVLPEGGLGQTQDMFRDSTSHLAWKHLGVLLPEAKEMAGKREVFFD